MKSALVLMLVIFGSIAHATDQVQVGELKSDTLSQAEINQLLEKSKNPTFAQCATYYEMDGLVQIIFGSDDNTPEDQRTQEQKDASARQIAQLKSYLKTGTVKVRPEFKNVQIPKGLQPRCNYIAQLATEKLGLQLQLIQAMAPALGKAIGEAMGAMITETVKGMAKGIAESLGGTVQTPQSTGPEVNPRNRN